MRDVLFFLAGLVACGIGTLLGVALVGAGDPPAQTHLDHLRRRRLDASDPGMLDRCHPNDRALDAAGDRDAR